MLFKQNRRKRKKKANLLLQPQFHRVHVQLLGQLIDNSLYCKGRLRLAGRAVGLHPLLIDHHVKPIDQKIIHPVRPNSCQHATTYRRAGECPSFVGQIKLSRGNLSYLGSANLGFM